MVTNNNVYKEQGVAKNMKNRIIYGLAGLTVGITMALGNVGCSPKYFQKKYVDLSVNNQSRDALANIYSELKYNEDSSVLAGHIFPDPEAGFKGDSLVFKFDENDNLIGRERYFGSDPNNIYFKDIISRNKKGRIKSIIYRFGEPSFKHASNLFPQAQEFKKESKVYEGNTNILLKNIKTKYFRCNSKTENYYLRNKKIKK